MALGIIPFGQDFDNRDMQQASGLMQGQYIATLTQAGTAAPSVSALAVNSIGTVAIARSGTGVYTLTTDGLWLSASNIQVTISGTAVLVSAVRTSANVVTISTFTEAGVAADLVGTAYVSIAVYEAQ